MREGLLLADIELSTALSITLKKREDMVIKFINDYKPKILINIRNSMQENVYDYDRIHQQMKFDR